jgi:hypothetical protein
MVLSETWFMEGYIDFEMQQYRLLAYLQDVKRAFKETKLYPQLADIVFHYNNLVSFRQNKRLLQDQFPRTLQNIDLQKMELVYERMLSDDQIMAELEHIVGFAVEEMKTAIDDGAEIYDHIEKQMVIEPVGIMPLYKNEGYMFLRYGDHSEVRVYNYSVSLFEHKNARYRGIKVDFVESLQKNLANTYEQIKIDVIRRIRTLPNPAVFKVEFPLDVPVNETLLPVAKRMLVKYL